MNRQEKIGRVLLKLRRKSLERFLELRDAMDRGDKVGNFIVAKICKEEGYPLAEEPTTLEIAHATAAYWKQCNRLVGKRF